MTLTRDKELWALALHVERQHGDDARIFMAKMLADAMIARDQVGIDLWKAVAKRWESLRMGDGAPN